MTNKSSHLKMYVAPGTTEDRAAADVATSGLAANAATVLNFSQPYLGELSLSDMVDSLKAAGKRVNANDLAESEQMLTAQAIALNAVFGEMCRRASLNMGDYLDASERYMRLALKAQGQCRATLETLAAIKNPPIVYAKQANIANGPQQVNNGPGAFAEAPLTPARGEFQQSKLLEEQHGSTLVDAGAARAAAGGHRPLEAVGAFDGAEERRRKSAG